MMKEESKPTQDENQAKQQEPRTIKSLVNTPFKKVMFGVQILSYVLIVGSPLIGGAIGAALGLKAARTGGVILGIFIAGEVLFYGSLIFLGKEIVLLVRDKAKGWFKKKPRD
jgi:lipopolysaccharide export LptBFGC system permease protein LptF